MVYPGVHSNPVHSLRNTLKKILADRLTTNQKAVGSNPAGAYVSAEKPYGFKFRQ